MEIGILLHGERDLHEFRKRSPVTLLWSLVFYIVYYIYYPIKGRFLGILYLI